MGGANSSQKTIEQFRGEFEEMKHQYDEHFGEVIVYRKINNKNFMVMAKDRIFSDESLAQKFLSRIQKRKRSHGDNVAKLLTVLGNKLINFLLIF